MKAAEEAGVRRPPPEATGSSSERRGSEGGRNRPGSGGRRGHTETGPILNSETLFTECVCLLGSILLVCITCVLV